MKQTKMVWINVALLVTIIKSEVKIISTIYRYYNMLIFTLIFTILLPLLKKIGALIENMYISKLVF